MTDFPSTWNIRYLGKLVDVLDARRVPVSAKERAKRLGTVPYYGATGQVGWIDQALFDEPLVLLGEDGVQFFDGGKSKSYLIDGPAWVNNHAHVLRAGADIDRKFLNYYLNAADYRGFANGTTRLKLTQAAMRRIPVPVPPPGEQRHIVELLEDHLSRLDAADRSLRAQGERLAALEALVAHNLTTGVGEHVSLASIARLITDGDHNPPKRVPAGVAHVTAKGIRPDGSIDLHSGTFVSEDGFQQTARRYLPTSGDIIVTCVGTIGRVALVPPGVRFSADRNLAAIRVDEEVARPDFISLALKGTRIQHQLRRASGSTAQPHLYLKDLRATTVQLPSLSAQSERVAEAEAQIGAARRLRGEAEHSARRSIVLRRSLLAAAISGRMTGAAPDLSEAEEMIGA